MLNHMFLAANRAQAVIGYVRLGYVSSVNPAAYEIKVQLSPDLTETGFIPYATPWYGWVAPPTPGQQALVLFQEGAKDVPIGAMLLYWDGARAPGVATDGDIVSGEMLLKHSSGSYITLNNNGQVVINGHTAINTTSQTLSITTTQNATLTVGANLTANVTGTANITAQGNATLKGANTAVTGGTVTLGDGVTTTGALALYDALKAEYDAHVHPVGGGDTGEPTVPLSGAASTTIVTGA
jgi:hypothetical protein